MNLILQLSNHAEDSQMLWRGPLEGLQMRFHYLLLFSISQSLLKDNAVHYILFQTHIDIREKFFHIIICLHSYFSNILEIIGSIHLKN